MLSIKLISNWKCQKITRKYKLIIFQERGNPNLQGSYRKQQFSLLDLNIIQLLTDLNCQRKTSFIQSEIRLLHSNFIYIILCYFRNHQEQQIPITQWIQIKYEAHANNPLWWRFWCFIKSDETVLLPADKFLFLWDLLMMLVTIVNIFYVPLQLSFNLNEDNMGSVFTLFSTLPSCIFLIDLILTFFKGYYDRGYYKRNKAKIFWHYIKGDFALDLAIVLPFILSWMGYSAANYLMLIRMTRVRRTMIVIEEISNFKEKSAIIYQLFCLIYSLLLISHFCACLFHYFALYEVDQGYTHTWLHQQNIFDEDLYTKYFNSLYWITITSMTVGYGDIVPVTTPEKILVTVITFLVTGVFGYALGMIQSIFYKMAEQTNLNNSRLRLVSNHIKQRGLNTQLQFRVRKYIEYYLQFKQDEELDLDELMGQLNPKLKQEVQIAMYYRYLKHSKLVGTNFADDIIKKLCFCIHEKTFAPEEVIIKQSICLFIQKRRIAKLIIYSVGRISQISNIGKVYQKISIRKSTLRKRILLSRCHAIQYCCIFLCLSSLLESF
uniref:K+ channel n=1 Tax=Paramecium tetraurelia TaxID=5888 RepID=Q27169_PARTE|nr:K+ channel [Paramecium tetraurelia]